MKDTNYQTITSKIGKALQLYRKRTDRYIGYTTHKLTFEIRRYKGTSIKPQNISILEKTIVKLISSGVTIATSICKFLGFNSADSVEYRLFEDSINRLLSFQLISETNVKTFSITSKGIDFINSGTLTSEYIKNFEVSLMPNYPNICSLDLIADNNKFIKKNKAEKYYKKDIELDLLKRICASQASHIYNPEQGLDLVSATMLDCYDCELEVYICFLQNIRDNSVKTIVYDLNTDSVLSDLSVIFETDAKLRDTLLKTSLINEVIKGNAIEVATGDKTVEQIEYEQAILSKDTSNEDTYNQIKGPGSMYDTLEFENELREIFELRNNEEVWLISPWIRDYAFINQRVPKIKNFLRKGGSVFLAYSQPEKEGEEMVQPASMKIVRNLERTYENFYYAELPKFHYKNVIEHRKGVTTLYTGSFNILSFTVEGHDEHYRKENMTQSNSEQSKISRNDFLEQFREHYINNTKKELLELNSSDKLYIGKLINLGVNKSKSETYNQIITDATNKGIILVDKRELYDEIITKAAIKILKTSYRGEEDYILAQLASLLYIYDLSREKEDKSIIQSTEKSLFELLQQKSLYKYCRINLRKGKVDNTKSIVNIVVGNINFEFGELHIPKPIFYILNSNKEYINFKEEGISKANDNIVEILSDAAKWLKMI